VVVGEPAQQLLRLGYLLGRHRQLVLLQLGCDLLGALSHPGPILDRFADVAEDTAQPVGDRALHGRIGLAVDFDMHPGLDDGVGHLGGARVGLALVADLEHLARDVATHDELGVHDEVD